ncbi:MAG: long-chain fatty acid--CoA ligase [Myxococcales bacterium]|nr:long-chain fatty acid--CoA ligase [Myxococcales bacterium]
MPGTMMDFPLSLTHLLRHGARVYGDSTCVTFRGDHTTTKTYREIEQNAARLANALARLGIRGGDRVGTFAWNNDTHLEAYFAVPCMGAVLHTLNIRLFPEQLAYVINHAKDRVIIVDGSIAPLLGRVVPEIPGVEHFIVVGEGDLSSLPPEKVIRYDALLAAEKPEFAWVDVDERTAAAICYTSGTTGHPKGVAYTHRSCFLHSLAVCGALHLSEKERILTIVPMFHANAWGLPYAAFMFGSSLHMPDRFLQPEPLANFIEMARPTMSGAVPTVWAGLLQLGEKRPLDLSSLDRIVCGGSAVPRVMIETLEKKYGVNMIQGWGMTEMNPLGTVAIPPIDVEPGTEEHMQYRIRAGRILPGVEARVVDGEGRILPWDGESVGELEVRGPWVTGSYYETEAPEKFRDGWLRTGDVVTIDPKGFVRITDREKDVIKSGGEWISSVDLENEIMGHPGVAEAAVVAILDERWGERPLACIVPKPNALVDGESIRAHLEGRVASFWLPEAFAFVDEIPKTSVGKFDKKVLRARVQEGQIEIRRIDPK